MLGTWIYQTTTTTGTGNLTLASVSGYPEFSTQFASGQRFQYQILDDSTGAPIESGVGYLSSGALVRERIECTMVSGTFDNTAPTAVSLAAGTKRVICSISSASAFSPATGAVSAATHKSYGDGTLVYGAGQSFSMTAGTAYAKQFEALATNEINAVLVNVTIAAVAGKLLRGAIYSIGNDGLPDVKLAESSTVAADTTGVKALSFTAMRPPQKFFVAVISDGTPNLYCTPSGTNRTALGHNSSLETYDMLNKAGTGATFPTSWASPGFSVSFQQRPILAVRCT
jgi:hypothetical protein